VARRRFRVRFSWQTCPPGKLPPGVNDASRTDPVGAIAVPRPTSVTVAVHRVLALTRTCEGEQDTVVELFLGATTIVVWLVWVAPPKSVTAVTTWKVPRLLNLWRAVTANPLPDGLTIPRDWFPSPQFTTAL
jgi:hypothetical protein